MAKYKENKQTKQKRIAQQKQQSLVLNEHRKENEKRELFFSNQNFLESKSSIVLTPLQRKISALFSWFDYFTQFFYIAFIITAWCYPALFSVQTIYNLTVIFIFEFILVHSGLFMAVLARTKLIFVLIPVYSVFAFMINSFVMGDENIVLWLYAVIVANRLIGSYQAKSREAWNKNVLNSAYMTLNFLFCIFLIAMIRFIVPYGGLTPEYLDKVNYLNLIASHSEYFNAPHVGMALGTLLYTIPFIFLTITMFSPLYKKIKFKFIYNREKTTRGSRR
ncbi:hypothetical protein ACPAVH_20730 [Enterobacteriaceae bacterium TYF_5]